MRARQMRADKNAQCYIPRQMRASQKRSDCKLKNPKLNIVTLGDGGNAEYAPWEQQYTGINSRRSSQMIEMAGWLVVLYWINCAKTDVSYELRNEIEVTGTMC